MVFMDVRMPRLNGVEAARRIRDQDAEGHRTPIIALTAHALPKERENLIREGMDDCLTKPVYEDQLWSILDHLVPQGEA